MKPATQNLTLYAGTTYRQKVKLTDANGTAINLTGYAVRMQVRRPNRYGPIVVDFVNGATQSAGHGSIDMTDAVNGEFELQYDAQYTILLGDVRGVYDLEIESAGGIVDKLMSGSFTVVGEVTR